MPTTTIFAVVPRAEMTLVPLTIVGIEETDNNRADAAGLREKRLPKAWVIVPKDGTAATCPDSSSSLGTIAVVNVDSVLLGWILGNRSVVHRLTCGLLGRHSTPHWSWMFLWILPAGMHVAVNTVVAAIIHSHPEYTTTFNFADLAILFFTRPRAGWIPVVLAGYFTNL